MKRLLLTILACMAAALCATAQTQQGYVKTIGKPGKKGQPLSGVTVRVKGGHNAVVSKGDGTFSMALPGQRNGQAYVLQQVQKQGYELNDRGVIGRQFAFSSTVPLTIVMVSSSQLQADKQRIENNAYKTAEKNYKAKLAKLEKQLSDKTISEEQYRTELQELQDKFEKYQSLIDELAEHYAHTDYDELDEKEVEINILIENGELERADSLIHTMFDPVEVLKRNKEALSRLDQAISSAQDILAEANADMAAVLKQQEKDAEYLYQLYTIALAQFDNEKAFQYIQTRAALDTTNVDWQNQAGRFVDEYLANYDLAMEYYQRGLRQALAQDGEQSEWVAASYDNLGSVHKSQGDYSRALEYFQKTLAIRERIFGSDHPDVAISYNNIGSVYDSQGDFSRALEYYQKSLAIRERVLGPDHPAVARCYNNLGELYRSHADYSRALEYHQKSLAISERILGSDHPDVATSYNNIGLVYKSQGDYARALEYHQKALSILERLYGPDHPAVATCYNNIGSVFNNQGDYARALEYHQKSLAIRERVLGPDHLNVALSYNNIGTVKFKQGDHALALEYFQKALAIYERVYAPDHPNVATCYTNIGYLYFEMEDFVKSLEYNSKAYEIYLKAFGPDHPETQAVKDNIDFLKEVLGQ